MITFLCCLAVLLCGYLFYSRYIERLFGADDRPTPATSLNDGIDYVPMKKWRLLLIQLLNIAGLGPIFGALNGALFGPIVYIWIIFGTIFAGLVHDYFSGMVSMRNGGVSISEVTGKYLGKNMLKVMRVFVIFSGILIGVVFSKGPAGLLALLTPERFNETFWFILIVIYYFVATFVPIDKAIGKIYPIFGICLIIMAVGVGGVILFNPSYEMPELWNSFKNTHPSNISVWPFMFITVACGAISGFHSTQSPMISRCCTSEKEGRMIFCGAMAFESVIALVWASAGISFYDNAQELLNAGAGVNTVVYEICTSTMGKIGGILAMLGVIVCPITSGDTSYRSSRLALADWLKIDQTNWKKRLLLSVFILSIGVVISLLEYQVIWRYFSWANQTLAMIVLWATSVYLKRDNKNFVIALIPAMFMTAVTVSYFVSAPECLGTILKMLIGESVYIIGTIVGVSTTIALTLLFFCKKQKLNF